MKEQFLAELKALLTQYNASINSIIEGDTHGISDEYIEIDIDGKTILTVRGWELTFDKIPWILRKFKLPIKETI